MKYIIALILLSSCGGGSGSSFDNKDLGLNGTYSFRDSTIVIANSMFFFNGFGCNSEGEMLGYSIAHHYIITGKKHTGCSSFPKKQDCILKLIGNDLDVYCPDSGISAVYEAN